ncbi:TPA: nucleoid-associated protein [Klebsiella variicola subsp. variicola]|nr:nucleoid-associated protein [Klebsiella variicola]
MASANIHHFIVHQIVRDSARAAFLKERFEENAIDEMTTEVVSSLLSLFNKSGLQTGSFSQESGKPKFEQTLLKYSNNSGENFIFDDFTQMTIDLARILEGEMNRGGGKSAKPNYIVFFHHTVNDVDYLSVVTLLETKGFKLENLSFQHVDRLDLDKLHLAARINLHHWVDEMEERYISFRIGRTGEMRDYFQDFIGCLEFTEAKLETKSLIDAIKECCFDIFSDNAVRTNEVLELAEKYCRESKDEDGKISIIALGKHLFPDNDDYLLEKTQSDKYKLSERVSIDNRSLKGLVRYRGSDKKMSISFDADLLTSKEIEYDRASGSLKFHKIPKDLKSSLDKENIN